MLVIGTDFSRRAMPSKRRGSDWVRNHERPEIWDISSDGESICLASRGSRVRVSHVPQTALWCSDNTQDFGSCVPSLNLGGAANGRKVLPRNGCRFQRSLVNYPRRIYRNILFCGLRYVRHLPNIGGHKQLQLMLRNRRGCSCCIWQLRKSHV